MKNLSVIETNEILELANQIKESQKAIRVQKESERIERLTNLIHTFKDLQPSESESIIRDILKIARNSDFYLFFKRNYVHGSQTCFYDGQNLTVIEKGNIKVSSLPFVIFLRKFKLEIFNYYGGKSEIEHITNEQYTSELQTVIGSVKIAQNIGVNLTTIAKNRIENNILGTVVKTQRKAEIKTFKQSLKKDNSFKSKK
jgi:hypothetical protein